MDFMTSGQLVLDPVLAAAIETARSVLVTDVPESLVGEHLGVEADAELVATHLFECLDKAYVGWRWAVSVTRIADSDHVTVNESVLLPGERSLIAPQWLPWQDRIEPGDLGAGDVLPTQPDDVRLIPGYTGADLDITEDDDLVPVLWELGLGRVRVLSAIGRDQATARWAGGDDGPDSPIARAANEQCSTCGFLIPLAGPLGQAFGLCANEFSPSDGHVVTLDHGCGAHSEAEPEPVPVPVVELVVDDLSPQLLDTNELTESQLRDLAEQEAAPAGTDSAVNEEAAGEEVADETGSATAGDAVNAPAESGESADTEAAESSGDSAVQTDTSDEQNPATPAVDDTDARDQLSANAGESPAEQSDGNDQSPESAPPNLTAPEEPAAEAEPTASEEPTAQAELTGLAPQAEQAGLFEQTVEEPKENP